MQHLQLTVGNIRELLSLQCLDDGKHAKQAPHGTKIGGCRTCQSCLPYWSIRFLDWKHINFDSLWSFANVFWHSPCARENQCPRYCGTICWASAGSLDPGVHYTIGAVGSTALLRGYWSLPTWLRNGINNPATCQILFWLNTAWMDEWMHGLVDEWMHGLADEWLNGWMVEWLKIFQK